MPDPILEFRRALYGLPRERFVTERQALARRLREAGDGERAAAVRALRRPSVALWAVNQLATRERTLLARFLSDAEQVVRGLREVLGGGRTEPYKRATTRERDELVRLTDAALEVAQEAGHRRTAALERKVTELLVGAARSDETRAALQAGAFDGTAPGAIELLLSMPLHDESRPGNPKRRESEQSAREQAADLEREASREVRAARRASARARAAAERARRAEQALLSIAAREPHHPR